METMSEAALQAYRALVYQTPGFIDYWRAATPLEEIKHLQIGSRPALRQPGSEDVTRIRAIPWVFSWMQSRCNLPGWYGVGAGVKALLEQRPGAMDLLHEMQSKWPFFQNLIKNTEMSLLKADMEIAALYDSLVPDRALAGQVFPRIREEYERTAEAVRTITGRSSLMEDEPEIQLAIQRRNPYVDPLNYIQVEMLRRIRALPDPEGEAAREIREVILLTINGIAAGLRSTG
jgi:phosphoenolpyruvate carboxylase